jgi:acyl dehydratase
MTAPVLAAMAVPRQVSAAELGAYRAVARWAATGTRPPADALAASPIHPFVLAQPAFERTLTELVPGPVVPVHLGQDIRVHRLIRPDEQVSVGVEVLGARREPRGIRLAVRAEVIGTAGAPIADLVTAVLLVGARSPEPFGDLPAGSAPALPDSTETVVRHVIPADLVPAYADASGDHNPIHLDPEAARAAGFPGVIAHGMSVLALVCEEIVDRYAAGDPAQVRGIGCRFSAPVAPGQPIELVLRAGADGRQVSFTGRTPQGTALKSGWAELSDPTPEGAPDESQR